ncbi:10402_t:CDS:2 [Scutellospora calospora]|uniref:10402_t:CDS:1 n=1 Tax=Scutellospora calospora TaxID=85575 RepID=A0ACA9JW77_9GLOM|nr:10402_t:CDS:2 [Scutellospora calospora]
MAFNPHNVFLRNFTIATNTEIKNLLNEMCPRNNDNTDYSVNSPNAGVVLNQGDVLSCSWTVNSETDKSIYVNLTHGDPQNLQQVMVLCSNLDPKVGTCNYTVPNNLNSGRDYAVMVGNDPNHIGISSYFAINCIGPLPPPSGCPNFGGHDCPQSLPCCSAGGFCGATDEHCGTGCDPTHSFSGQCSKPDQSSPPTTSAIPSPTDNTCGDVKCTADFPCCSAFKFCGNDNDHCGEGCVSSSSFNGQCVIPGQ